MALQQLDLSVTQGEDRTYGPYTFSSADPSGLNNLGSQAYYNFTGAAARMQIRQNESGTSTELLALTSSSGVIFSSVQSPGGPAAPTANNSFAVTIPKATSLTLPTGVYYYDLFIDWPTGTSQSFLAGTFTVLPTVTR